MTNLQEHPQLELRMPRDSIKMIQSFKPFLENSTAEEKLSLLTKSSFIKPSRRTQKMLDKQQANP